MTSAPYCAETSAEDLSSPSRREPAGQRAAVWSAWLLLLVGGSLLAVGAFIGYFVRPAAEDWCFAWRTRDSGTLGLIRWLYMDDNGRAGNAALLGSIYSHGTLGPRVLPTVLALTLVAGTFVLARLLLKGAGWSVPGIVVLAAATGVGGLLLLGGATPYQIFLWAPGAVSHTVPSVLAVWTTVLILVTHRSAAPRRQVVVVTVVGLVGTFIGVLSEAATAVCALLGLAGVLLLAPRARRRREWFPFAWPVAWLSGLVVGFVILITSPGVATRRERSPVQASLFSADGLSGVFAQWGHVLGHVLGQPAYLGALALGLLVGLSSTPAPTGEGRAMRSRAKRTGLLAVPFVLVTVSSLLVVVELRSGYGRNGWTYQRTWTNFLFPWLLALGFYGVVLGGALRRMRRPVLTAGGFVVALGAGVAALVAVSPTVVQLMRTTVPRSIAWDAENARIERDLRRGDDPIAFRPYPIAGMSEPFSIRDGDRDWVAGCVADYYHVVRVYPSFGWLQSADSKTYRGIR